MTPCTVRWLAAGFPLQRPRFNPRAVHVEFVMDRVALGQATHRELRCHPATHHSTIAPYFFVPNPELCDSPNLAESY
jgi:hypothetical protein